jgi:hypothetical protein
MADLILYTSTDGRTRLDLRAEGQTVWLTQLEIAELFQTTKQNVSLHAKNIFDEGELTAAATVKESLTVQTEGSRQVKRSTLFYNLDLILAIGYRVRSTRGTEFRQWATAHLREFLVKGFLMDDERLKDPRGWDYFDELLARIREIRASEKRFYQKVRDLFALSSDYQSRERETQVFFAEVQNKLLYAVTRHTAAELVVARANPAEPNMALTAWSGSRVRKQDVIIAKNYLTEDEVDTLNRLVVIFLEQAELRAKEKKALTLDYWRANVDRLLEFNDKPVLQGPGRISHEQMKQQAEAAYERFDTQRRTQEALEADAADLREIEEVEKQLNSSKPQKS